MTFAPAKPPSADAIALQRVGQLRPRTNLIVYTHVSSRIDCSTLHNSYTAIASLAHTQYIRFPISAVPEHPLCQSLLPRHQSSATAQRTFFMYGAFIARDRIPRYHVESSRQLALPLRECILYLKALAVVIILSMLGGCLYGVCSRHAFRKAFRQNPTRSVHVSCDDDDDDVKRASRTLECQLTINPPATKLAGDKRMGKSHLTG